MPARPASSAPRSPAWKKPRRKILHEAERVDEYARTLGSTLKTDYERGLAQDIQDHTVQIYEACNFQDLAGQRIAKVIETLNLVEAQLSAMLARCNGQATRSAGQVATCGGLINGPKLDGDTATPASTTSTRYSASSGGRIITKQVSATAAKSGGERERAGVGDAVHHEGHHQRRRRLHDQPGAGEPSISRP